VAELVGLGAAVIPGQLDLEIVLGVAQVSEREPLEIVAGGNLEREGLLVEAGRRVKVLHPDHDVNRLCHPIAHRSYPTNEPRRLRTGMVVSVYYAPTLRRGDLVGAIAVGRRDLPAHETRAGDAQQRREVADFAAQLHDFVVERADEARRRQALAGGDLVENRPE